ncbi:MAG: sulfotransferase domain-containing protein [Opitutales bacterium]|nr:sulfotransferase domain-containing protein [Opitutales bacterium]MCH8539393.1 sulfotransferase domain-containing protein [Opitutales bacterium]
MKKNRTIPWLILNGAAKSGSTWLVQLIRKTNTWTPIPNCFQQDGWRNSCVDETKLLDFVLHSLEDNKLYYTKQHWNSPRLIDQISARSKAIPIVANILRDPRDMVLSRYHHNLRHKLTDLPLNKWIKLESSKFILQNKIYHSNWVDWGARNKNHYVYTVYEALHSDLSYYGSSFLIETHLKMGLNISEQQAAACANLTEFNNIPDRHKGSGKFFRKGTAGAFVSEITKEEEDFILKLACDVGYAELINSVVDAWPWMRDFTCKYLEPSNR